MSLSLKQLQARVERVERMLDQCKQARDHVTDPILKAYELLGCSTEDVEFLKSGVRISYSWEDGGHEREQDDRIVPYSVIDAEDPIQAAKDAAVEAKASAELREYERLRQKLEHT